MKKLLLIFLLCLNGRLGFAQGTGSITIKNCTCCGVYVTMWATAPGEGYPCNLRSSTFFIPPGS